MSPRDRTLYLLLAGVTFAYVVLRAVLVPMVHDECASALWYVQPGEWLPFQAHWDANNHFLSSGLGVLFARLFGVHAWALRLGSVLSFGLYAWAAWRLGTRIRERLVRWCYWLAMLSCPFALDFFSMFRGYAIELAGWAVALDGLLRYASSRALRHLLAVLVGSMVAGAALVALLPVWCIALGLAGLLFLRSRKDVDPRGRAMHVVAFLLLGGIPVAFAAKVALYMKELGLLYYGSTEGFVEVTVSTLCLYVIGSDHAFVVLAVVLLVLIATMTILHKAWRERMWFSPQTIALVLLWTDVFARIVMAHVMDVNYPEDRAGIHLIPLVLLLFALAVDGLAIRAPVARWSAALLLVLPSRALFTANVDHCLIWPEQCVPARIVDRVLEKQRELARAPVLGGHHQLKLPWLYASRASNALGPLLQADYFPDGEHDLRLVDSRYLSTALPGYHAVDSARGPGLWLLERDTPLRIEALDTIAEPQRTGTDMYYNLAVIDSGLVRQHALHLDARVPVRFQRASPEVEAVLQVSDSAGTDLIYEGISLCALRATWDGDTLCISHTLPRLPDARRAILYIFNARQEEITLGPSRVELNVLP